ncbi:hypothetical protein SSTU70S_00877 [Stutzerimonas stutzeri]
MLMRRRDLNPMQELIIHTWLDQFPELGMAYKLKEAFFDIWEATTEAEARARYQEWLNAIPEGHKSHWKPLITSMTNWEREISRTSAQPSATPTPSPSRSTGRCAT